MAVCLILTLLPATALAAEGDASAAVGGSTGPAASVATQTITEDTTNLTSGTWTMSGDVMVKGALQVAEGANVTMDLGGNTLTLTAANGETYTGDFSVDGKAYSTKAPLINKGTLTIQNGTITFSCPMIIKAGIVNTDTGTLTIKDSATIKVTSFQYNESDIISNIGGRVITSGTLTSDNNNGITTFGGTVEITGGSITANGAGFDGVSDDDAAALQIFSEDFTSTGKGANVTISGGELESYAYAASTNNQTSGDSNLTITGGTLTSVYSAIYWPSAGTLTIGREGSSDGPTISTGGSALEICSGTLNIYGGTLDGNSTGRQSACTTDQALLQYYRSKSGGLSAGDAVTIIANRSAAYAANPLHVNITGGTFTSVNNYGIRYLDCDQGTSATLGQDVSVSISGGHLSGDLAAVDASFVAADNQNFITGGDFSSEPDADYVDAGYTIQYNDDDTYTVVAKQANAAEVVPAAPEVKKPADLTGNDAATAETVASALATTEVVTGTGLNAAATGVANENTITAATPVEDTTVLGKLQTAASDPDITAEAVTIVIQPYMNVEIQDVDTAARTLTVDVTPMYRTVATTNPDNIQLTGGNVNAVEIGTAQKLTITKPVTVKIPVPDSVAGTNTTAYVTHIKDDGTMYVYTGTISGAAGSKVLTFENPNGFSTLKVTTGKPVAAIGKTTYTSLQDAIDKAKPGETVKLLDDVTLSGGDGNTKGVITIANKDIILDGNHFMLKADGVVDKTSMINVQYTPTGKTVTIKDLKIDSNGEAKHGININGASVSVETVEIVDGTGYGIVCNNSTLSVNGLTTSGNGWGGINVDASDAQDSSLTVLSATLNEQNSIIFENRNNKNITATIEDGSFQKVGAHATDGTNLDKMNITINGGSFAGLSSTSTSAAGQKATITVNDGTFAVPVSDVADTPDYQVGSSQNGYRYYETLSEAMKDVKDGDTLTNVHASAVYTVTFKYNDGVHDDVEAQLPATFNLPSVPSRSGYTFGGWSDGTRTFAPEAAVTIQGNTVFNGFWSSNDSSSSHRPSSGSSSTGDYAITVDAGKHGDVSVSPKRADEGDTVTITADPDNGYVVDEVIVTDKNGDDIRVRDRGDGEYTFTMPDSKVTVEVTFVEAGDELSFVDVAKSDYYYDAVKWAVENGVTTGVTDTIFAPGNPCTRAQTVTFLWRAAGMPQAANRVNPFTDVSVNDYYYEAVLWAVENGITGGTTATTFSPNATCTRAQVVTFLWRYSKEDASILPMFTDVAEGDYYYGAVAWAVENGVTTGVTDTSFVPGNPCTRGQIVTFLYRYMGK